MSIFHIPELFDLIRPEIAKQDLVHCCRVNKSWNAAFTPSLWQSFPPEPPTKRHDGHQWRIRIYACLRSLIEEDLLYEQGQEQKHPQPGDTLNHFNNSSNDDADFLLPALTRNGRWLQTLIIDQQMLKAPFCQQPYQITSAPPLDPNVATIVTSTTPVHPHRHHSHNPRLDTAGFLLHLLKRCPHLQSLQLTGQDSDAAAYYFWKKIATVGFPESIKDLNIKITSCVPMEKSTLLPSLLRQCPLGLHKLRIDFVPWKTRYRGVLSAVADTWEDEATELLPSLRDLRIVSETPGSSPESCGRFLSRCFNLESLTVDKICPMWASALKKCDTLQRLFIQPNERSDYLHHLDSVLGSGLPNLDTLHLCTHYYRLEDSVIASVLAKGHKGWKSLVIPFLDKRAAKEVMKHCSTLEELEVRRAVKLPSGQIRQVLSTFSKLVRFEALVKDWYRVRDETHISAEDLIDLDPLTNSLTPWPCESTLKVFRVRISGIPRPRVTRIAQEQYPGQGREIQRQVYGRLARFTNLERLELGHPGVRFDEDYPFYPPYGEENRNIREDRVDCLEMTLESGLDMLEGLTELRELSVSRMASSVGVEEVKWMIRHWPALKAIRGLTPKDWVGSDDEAEYKSIEWLRTNCPQIDQDKAYGW